jgi:hypothetical protein
VQYAEYLICRSPEPHLKILATPLRRKHICTSTHHPQWHQKQTPQRVRRIESAETSLAISSFSSYDLSILSQHRTTANDISHTGKKPAKKAGAKSGKANQAAKAALKGVR